MKGVAVKKNIFFLPQFLSRLHALKVQPFGSIAGYVKDDCPRLLINRDLVGDWEYYYEECPDKNYRDVAFKGDCDEGCLKLAELIGLKQELLDLVKSDHERLDRLIDKN